MHKCKAPIENETLNIFWDFEIQVIQTIPTRIGGIVFIEKKIRK